jgi:hypothetical protein
MAKKETEVTSGKGTMRETTIDGVYELKEIGDRNGEPVCLKTLIEPSQKFISEQQAEAAKLQQFEVQETAKKQSIEDLRHKLESGHYKLQDVVDYILLINN